MRKSLILMVLLVSLPAAFGARRLTVQELEQYAASLKDKPEAEQAYRIADLELTERLSPARMARLMAIFPAEQTREALISLADRSGFQKPPAAELPTTAAPDVGEQKRIMGLTAAYVAKTVPQLPNFFATRATTQFEDSPLIMREDGFIPFEPMHRVDSFRVTSLYRDGQEVQEGTNAKTAKTNLNVAGKTRIDGTGLTSWGEFGPILSTVLLDAARSSLAWSHWENGTGGPLAIFHYEVPKEKSHYEVRYCCITKPGSEELPILVPFHELTGYHGEISVDPATGAILRLTAEAELRVGAPVQHASLLVEYGPVEIGGRRYICPVRSISLSQAEMVQVSRQYEIPKMYALHPQRWMLNDVSFEDYHLFRAESKIAADVTPEPAGGAAAVLDGRH